MSNSISILDYAHNIEQYEITFQNEFMNKSNEQIIDLYQENPEGYEDAVLLLSELKNNLGNFQQHLKDIEIYVTNVIAHEGGIFATRNKLKPFEEQYGREQDYYDRLMNILNFFEYKIFNIIENYKSQQQQQQQYNNQDQYDNEDEYRETESNTKFDGKSILDYSEFIDNLQQAYDYHFRRMSKREIISEYTENSDKIDICKEFLGDLSNNLRKFETHFTELKKYIDDVKKRGGSYFSTIGELKPFYEQLKREKEYYDKLLNLIRIYRNIFNSVNNHSESENENEKESDTESNTESDTDGDQQFNCETLLPHGGLTEENKKKCPVHDYKQKPCTTKKEAKQTFLKVHPDKNVGCPEYSKCKMEESFNRFNCNGDGAYWEWREENKDRLSDISFSYWSKNIDKSNQLYGGRKHKKKSKKMRKKTNNRRKTKAVKLSKPKKMRKKTNTGRKRGRKTSIQSKKKK